MQNTDKMGVSFSEKLEVRWFQRTDKSEHMNLWWSMSDYFRFQKHSTKTIRLHYRLTNTPEDDLIFFEDGDVWCLRGLESRGGQEGRVRQHRIRDTVQSVIKAQKRLPDEEIAQVYSDRSLDSKTRAQVRGFRDERAVLIEFFVEQARSKL